MHGDDGAGMICSDDEYEIIEPQEMFKALPDLAKRLGVEPNTGEGSVHCRMLNGDNYDLMALVNAFLDRVDEATK